MVNQESILDSGTLRNSFKISENKVFRMHVALLTMMGSEIFGSSARQA